MKTFYIKTACLMAVFLFMSVSVHGQDSTKTKQELKKKVVENKNIQHGRNFVDENGDGFNDNAPDHDGDGIPNGLDPDYKKGKVAKDDEELPYVDLNGDGINDNLQFGKKRKRFGKKTNENTVEPQSGNAQHGNTQKGKQKGKGRK